MELWRNGLDTLWDQNYVDISLYNDNSFILTRNEGRVRLSWDVERCQDGVRGYVSTYARKLLESANQFGLLVDTRQLASEDLRSISDSPDSQIRLFLTRTHLCVACCSVAHAARRSYYRVAGPSTVFRRSGLISTVILGKQQIFFQSVADQGLI